MITDGPFRNKRILTVDDSTTIRNYLRMVLTSKGAQVEAASTGAEALQKCAAGSFDLILLDLLLPDMNGLHILEAIRKQSDGAAVVMLTGSGGIKSAISAVQQGADGYLEKQDLTAGDTTQFFYALEQAIGHRAGLRAQKQLEQMRADFYSMVTHDLRSPAGAVLVSTQMLLDGEMGPLEEQQHEVLSLMQAAAAKMLSLINNYLDYAKIDAGYLRLERRDAELRQIVETSARLAALQASARQQTLTLDLPDEPVPAHVDPERLTQVLDNLISNAIKYTPEGGQINVQLRAEDGQAVFRIRDTGVGIPPEQLPALFAKFHRVPGENTRAIRGTGLGLLIVKEIVEAHGGHVRAESAGVRGQGTTFTITLPTHPGASP